MEDFKELREKISKCWNKKTSYFGKEGSRGQCYVTAMLVQDLLGGRIYKCRVDDETHYINCLDDGEVLDFTSDQYGGNGFNPVKRCKILYKVDGNRKNKRYQILLKKYAGLV